MAPSVAKANGTYKKNPNRERKDCPQGLGFEPDMPDIVAGNPGARRAWVEACDCLRGCGILSATDLHLLTSYALTTGEYFRCMKAVQREGYSNEKGSSSAEAIALFKLGAQHIKLLSELGLSPSSRARLTVTDNKQGSDVGLQDILEAMQQRD